MGRQKADLLRNDNFALSYATFLAAKIFRRSFLTQKTATITIEAEDIVFWDDLLFQDFDGKKHRYQIKRQQTDLTKKLVVDLVRTITDKETIYHLILPCHIDVNDVGNTRILRELCRRTQQDGSSLEVVASNLRENERGWIAFISELRDTTEIESLRLLQLLRLETVGYESDLEEKSHEYFAELYDDPKVQANAWQTLQGNLRTSDGAAIISTDLLKQWLPNRQLGKFDDLYMGFVKQIEETFDLDNWPSVCDHLIGDLLHEKRCEKLYELVNSIDATAFPGAQKNIEVHLANFSSHLREYLSHFCSRAELYGDYLREDKIYKRLYPSDKDHNKELDNSRRWQNGNNWRLINLIVSINELFDSYRAAVDPQFRVKNGRLMFCDSMGVTNDMNPYRMAVKDYIDLSTGKRISTN